MKYLLVALSMKGYLSLVEYCMPMGIAYINAAMRNAGFDVSAMNMLFEVDAQAALQRRIIEEKTDVLLCGGLSSEYPGLRQVYQAARAANPNIIIIGGGGGFTSEPIAFSELLETDYAVIGEGEQTCCELARALEEGRDVSGIPGIVYRSESGYRFTGHRDYIRDVDSIPFPCYDGLNMEEYLANQHSDGWYNYYAYYSDTPRMMPMLMARSCPYQCSFCFHPIGKGYRARSLDNFFAELDCWIEKYHINGIALVDECFSIDKNRVMEFCRRIKPYGLKWACQMRADTYSDELLRCMKDSGCIGACFGIESMSERVLENMNKRMETAAIENALALTYKYRIGCNGNLIFGAEAETLETMRESLIWHMSHGEQYQNRPVRHFAYVQTYPGSIYFDNACLNGKIKDKKEFIRKGDWNLNITSLSDEDYAAMGDVICLLRMENYNVGEIIDIKHNADEPTVDFTFRCSYCGEVNRYKRMNAARFTGGKLRELGCRHCNMLGEYILEPQRYPYDQYRMIPWLLDMLELDIPDSYFRESNIHTVGIYGMNAFSKRLIGVLRRFPDLHIAYICDELFKRDIDYYGVKKLDGGAELPNTDLIIVGDMVHRLDIIERLSRTETASIIDLETIIRKFAIKAAADTAVD